MDTGRDGCKIRHNRFGGVRALCHTTKPIMPNFASIAPSFHVSPSVETVAVTGKFGQKSLELKDRPLNWTNQVYIQKAFPASEGVFSELALGCAWDCGHNSASRDRDMDGCVRSA